MNLSMKTFCLLLVISCTQVLPVNSQQITKERALEKANRFVTSAKMGQMKRSSAVQRPAQLTLASNTEDYYVFNDEQNGGYVIIGGDERQQEVLGYSRDGHFDANCIPDNLQWLLDGCARETAYLRAHPNYVPPVAKRVKGVVVSPLLDCTWGQGFPYFNMCPTVGGNHCLTGCVPTAFAQIMYYHKWPEKGKGQVGYEYDGQTFSADLSQSTYRWDLMLPSYDENSSQTSQDAVALLMKDVGYAFHTFYGLEDSGASGEAEQFLTHFDYDQSMRILYRAYCDQETWDNTIVGELENNRPVYLDGGSPTGAHAMVIDGCDSEGYFHFNFGWDGRDNAYFATSGIYFNADQSILVGIKKNEGGQKTYTFCANDDFMYLPEEGWMTITGYGLRAYHYGRSDDAYYTALAVENIATHDIIYCNEEKWGRDYWIPIELSDGDYKVYPVARAEGQAWQKVLFSDNRQSYVDLIVTNGVRTFANNNLYDGLQDGAYEINGVYYFLDFDAKEAIVTFKNDKYDGYSGDVTIPGHVSYEGTDFTVTTIGDYAFRECKIGTLTIPNTVKTIETSFYSANIGKIVFEAGSQLENIGGLCFNALKTRDMEFNLPEGLSLLPTHIFQSCWTTWISLPSTLTTIEGTPFNYSWNLRTLVVNNPTPIQLSKDFFVGVDWKLCTLYVPEGSVERYASAENWKDFGQIKVLEDTVTVDGVKYILHDKDLTATVFNAYGVQTETFTLPSTITCKGKSYTVTDLGCFAFSTTSIKSLTVPSGINYFGEGCFMGVEHSAPVLDKLTLCHETPPEVADTKYAEAEGFVELFFQSGFWVTELHVPMGSKAKYEAHSLWGRFTNIVEDDMSGIETVTSEADCQNEQGVYSLSGIKLNAIETNSLPKGIYIRNGKKVVIK